MNHRCINCNRELTKGEFRSRMGRYELCQSCANDGFRLSYADRIGQVESSGLLGWRIAIFLDGVFRAWAWREAKRGQS